MALRLRRRIRHAALLGWQLLGFAREERRWWVPLVVVVLLLAGLGVAAGQLVVPTAVYTLI